jgi:hypothetical protein
MAHPLRIHLGFPVACQFHQIDAAARGIHFFVPKDVGWAHRQAEAAVDALVDELSRRGVMSVESAKRGGCRGWFAHLDGTNEPAWIQRGFRIELLLHRAHKRERVARVAPCVELRH